MRWQLSHISFAVAASRTLSFLHFAILPKAASIYQIIIELFDDI